MKRLIPLLFSLPLLAATPSAPADTLLEDGHYKRARALAEERLRTSPNDPETLWLVSHVKQAWQDLNAGVEFAEKAVAADPKSARYHLRLAEALGEAAQKAGVLKQIGLARRFKKEIDTTIALDPHNADALTYLMEFYVQAPGIVGGDKTKAHAIPEQILAFDPVKGAFAQVALANHDKQRDGIEQFYRKAVEARPASYEAHTALGGFCFAQKKFDEAEQHSREAIRINAGRAGGHGLKVAALIQQTKWAEVDPALAEAEKQVPDNLWPYFRAGNNCLALKTELPRAERYFRKYLAQEPEPDMPSHAAAHWRLALVLEQQARKQDAIAELQTAVKMDSNSPAKQDLKRLK
jgi:tetratricopeptide (TPR) repeat protein